MSMVEITFSIVLVGGLMVAALNTLSTAVHARQFTSNHSISYLLAQDLMTEILQQEYRENKEMVTFGREIGESDGTRLHFDDVDDYNNWSASPPQTKDGTVLPNLNGWQRNVSVMYVTADDLTQSSIVNDGIKNITITIVKDGITLTRLYSIKTSSESMSKALRSTL